MAETFVTLYHETLVKPEIIRKEGLVPPDIVYTTRLVANTLGINTSDIDQKWLEASAEGPLFQDVLYGLGYAVKIKKNLFFWIYKPTPTVRPAERNLLLSFALELVGHSGRDISEEYIRESLFSNRYHIVEVRIPGSWLWGIEPGFLEWFVEAQGKGERVDIEIEVARPIPPNCIISIT